MDLLFHYLLHPGLRRREECEGVIAVKNHRIWIVKAIFDYVVVFDVWKGLRDFVVRGYFHSARGCGPKATGMEARNNTLEKRWGSYTPRLIECLEKLPSRGWEDVHIASGLPSPRCQTFVPSQHQGPVKVWNFPVYLGFWRHGHIEDHWSIAESVFRKRHLPIAKIVLITRTMYEIHTVLSNGGSGHKCLEVNTP